MSHAAIIASASMQQVYTYMRGVRLKESVALQSTTHRLWVAKDPEREREKLYTFSSQLGLIRCLTPVRVSAIIYSQAFLDKHRNTTNIILPHKLNHGSCMLSKQP